MYLQRKKRLQKMTFHLLQPPFNFLEKTFTPRKA